MISGTTHIVSPRCFIFLFCLVLIFAHPVFAQDNTPAYQNGVSGHDYRSLTTLNEFTRMVYRDRWKGIEAEDLLAELAKFKTPSNSPAMRDIWRNVALGDFIGLEVDNQEQQTQLMAQRLHLLNRLGLFDEAVRLYQKVAEHKPVPALIARQGVEALALAGSADGACLEVKMAAKYLASDEWQQDAALCAAYFGDKTQAKDLYAKAAPKAGSGFRTIYKMLNSQSGKAIHVGIPALWRTLLLAQGATVPNAALTNADAMTLASIANNPHVPLAAQLTAARRAADHSTISFERLRKLYETKHPSETGIDSLLASAKAGEALLPSDYYAPARFTFEGNERATIVKNALHAIKPVTNVKSHVYGWIVDKLTLQLEFNKIAWFAPEGYSLMVLTNRMASADMYYESGNLKATHFAYINALIKGQPWPAEQISQWEKAMHKRYGKAAQAKIDMLMALAHAYDQEDKLKLRPIQNQPSGSKVLQKSIDLGGLGLTLVSALNQLAEKNQIKDLSTEQFVDIVRNMTRQGLFGERKKITLEFLVQNML